MAREDCRYSHAIRAKAQVVVVPAEAPILQLRRPGALTTQKDLEVVVETTSDARRGSILEVLRVPDYFPLLALLHGGIWLGSAFVVNWSPAQARQQRQ